MNIAYLKDHPDFIKVLAPEICEHWKEILPDETLEGRMLKLEKHMNIDLLPIAVIAYEDNEIFGTASLRDYDIEPSDPIKPWLGGVFVRKKYRGRGIGSRLCAFIESLAWSMGYSQLYLFTLDKQRMYTRLRWSPYQHIIWNGKDADIMKKLKPSGQ